MAAFKAQQFQKAKRQAFDAGLPVVRVFSTTEAVSLAPKRVLQIVCDALRLDEGSGVVYQQPMWGCSSAEGRSSIDMSFEVTCAATRHTNKKNVATMMEDLKAYATSVGFTAAVLVRCCDPSSVFSSV